MSKEADYFRTKWMTENGKQILYPSQQAEVMQAYADKCVREAMLKSMIKDGEDLGLYDNKEINHE